MNINDIEAISTAAEATAISLKNLKLQLDCGTCVPAFAGNDSLFISHPHPDHWGGLINYIFLRKIKKMPPPKIYIHADICGKFTSLVRQAADMTGSVLPADFIGVRSGDSISFDKKYKFEFSPVEHRSLPALALTVIDEAGKDLLSYTGDTSPETFKINSSLLNSSILITECTYLGKDTSLLKAHEFSHMHLDDLYAVDSCINSEIIALMHLSVRYRASDLIADVKNRAPASLRERFYFIPPLNKKAKFIRVLDI